jgi:hypothetical protein
MKADSPIVAIALAMALTIALGMALIIALTMALVVVLRIIMFIAVLSLTLVIVAFVTGIPSILGIVSTLVRDPIDSGIIRIGRTGHRNRRRHRLGVENSLGRNRPDHHNIPGPDDPGGHHHNGRYGDERT